MRKKFYEEYHKIGPGASNFVGEKKIPLNDINKALFVENYLKGRILDAGCGSGFDVNYFHNRWHDIEGTDMSETAIEKARRRYPGIRFFIHDFESSRLDEKYGTICCFEVLEHILDYQSFLKNISHSLEEKGRLIVSTPNIFGLSSYLRLMLRDGTVFGIGSSDDSHIRFFSTRTLKDVLSKLGFETMKIKTFSTSRIPLPNGWGGSIVIVCERS